MSFDPDTRFFTPTEANKLLAGVVELVNKLIKRADEARVLADSASSNPSLRAQEALVAEADSLKAAAEGFLREVNAIGVHLKGVDPILVDFPALRNGQESYLCWRDGDGERIEWWHPLHTGIDGRQPLDYGALGEWEWLN